MHLHRHENLLMHLLDAGNEMIGKILASELMAPPRRATLYQIQQLQRIEIILQNKLVDHPFQSKYLLVL